MLNSRSNYFGGVKGVYMKICIKKRVFIAAFFAAFMSGLNHNNYHTNISVFMIVW